MSQPVRPIDLTIDPGQLVGFVTIDQLAAAGYADMTPAARSEWLAARVRDDSGRVADVPLVVGD